MNLLKVGKTIFLNILMTIFSGNLGTFFLGHSVALLPGHILALLTRNLFLNNIRYSFAFRFGYRHTNISSDILAFFLWDRVGNRSLCSLTFLLGDSFANLIRDRLAHLLWLVRTFFLGNNLWNFLLDIMARFSWDWSADRHSDGSTLLNSLIICVFFRNKLAFLSGLIMTLFPGLVPTLLLGNIIADHSGNIVARLTRLIPAFLLGNLVAHLFWLIPTLHLRHILAFHGRDRCTLLFSIVGHAHRILNHVALSGFHGCALLFSSHMTLCNVISFALTFIDCGANLLLVLMTFTFSH